MRKKGCLKLIKSSFSYHTKSFSDKVPSKLNAKVESYSSPNCNTKIVPNDDVFFGLG